MRDEKVPAQFEILTFYYTKKNELTGVTSCKQGL